MAIAHLDERPVNLLKLRSQLIRIQCRLQELNSCVATPIPKAERKAPYNKIGFSDKAAKEELEAWIDEMTETLPPLKVFILPSGGVVAAQLHVARTVCRRAERAVVDVNGEGGVLEPSVIAYINRLSDYLFTAARFATAAFGAIEESFVKPDALE